MSLLDYNEITQKKVIIYDEEPCVVISSHVARTQMRKPTNQTKLKSLVSGKVFQAVFQASDQAPEADIEKRSAKYLYKNKNEYWFCDPSDPKNRFIIDPDVIGDQIKWVRENSEVTIKVFIRDDETEVIIGLDTPVKVDLLVTDAPPNVRGDTATGGRKIVKLETGAELSGVPLFIEAGDVIRVNTDLGEYVERVSSKK